MTTYVITVRGKGPSIRNDCVIELAWNKRVRKRIEETGEIVSVEEVTRTIRGAVRRMVNLDLKDSPDRG